MSKKEIQSLEQYLEKKFEMLQEENIQHRSAQHSDLLKLILENTKMTKEIREHPIFKAWEDGKTLYKFVKWGGLALVALSTVLLAIKNGGLFIRDIIHYIQGK